MYRVYVAGPYSSDNVIGVLDNIREGMRWSTQILLSGFAPFCPWHDFHFQLMLKPDERLTVDDYYGYSMAWLEASDAMFLIPGWEKSHGTQQEYARADELGIPCFWELEDLELHFEFVEKHSDGSA